MKKLLVVDDQPVIRKMLCLALRDHFEIEELADADAAYASVMAERPAGIVLDVMMPGSMNGFQLCERIKRDAELSFIHIVLVTACGQVSDQELGRAVGADAYFVKPFSPVALARHLTDALLPAGGPAAVRSEESKTMIAANQAPASDTAETAWTLSPWGLAAICRDGKVSRVNPAFEQHTGITAATALGMREPDFAALLALPLSGHRRVDAAGSSLSAIHYFPPVTAAGNTDLRLSRLAEVLREPLTSIYGFAELLLTQDYPEEIRDDLMATLLKQVEVMSNIINEDLDISSRKAGGPA